MAVGIFTDKAHRPTDSEIIAAVGAQSALWKGVLSFIQDSFRLSGDFAFYGKNYGWALRFRKGGKALVSLYPGQDSFTAQVVLTEEQVEQASCLGLGQKAKEIIESAHPYPEGRWIFIRVDSEPDLLDIQRLLRLKGGPTKPK